MLRSFVRTWMRGIFWSQAPRDRVVTAGLGIGALFFAISEKTPVRIGDGEAAMTFALGHLVAAVLLLVGVMIAGVLAWVRTPRLDIVFDPADQACMFVTKDDHGRTDRMYRVIIVNNSSSTIENASVWITQHFNQGSSILPQRIRFKDERFQGQRSENYEQLSKISPGKSAQRYADVVSHFDASQDYPILMKFALTDIPNELESRPYVLTLVAKSYNAPEVTRQFEIDTNGPHFQSLTFKSYTPSRCVLRLFGREFAVRKIGSP